MNFRKTKTKIVTKKIIEKFFQFRKKNGSSKIKTTKTIYPSHLSKLTNNLFSLNISLQLQDALDREKGEKDLLQASHDELEARLQELEARYQNLLDENGQLKLMLAT